MTTARPNPGTWEPPTVARMLRLALVVMERGAPELGVELAHDALAHTAGTLGELAKSVRYHVHTEDPPLGEGPRTFRAFARSVERGEFDGERDALPFDAGSLAVRFAAAVRLGDTPDTSPIAARLAEWISTATADLAIARRAAMPDGAFTALPVQLVTQHVRRIGLDDELVVVPGEGFGTVLRGTGPDGRDFVSRCAREGWAAAMLVHDRVTTIAGDRAAISSTLAEAGLWPGAVEVSPPRPGDPEGAVALRARNNLGRNVVALAQLRGLAVATRVGREILDDQRAAAERAAVNDRVRAAIAAGEPPTAADLEACTGSVHAAATAAIAAGKVRRGPEPVDREAGGGIAHAVAAGGPRVEVTLDGAAIARAVEGVEGERAQASATRAADERVRAAIAAGTAPAEADLVSCSREVYDEAQAAALRGGRS